MAESQYLSIAASKSGALKNAIPKISKHLVAYMAGLVAVSPYKNGPFDSRAKGVAEHAAAEAYNQLNKLKNEPYYSSPTYYSTNQSFARASVSNNGTSSSSSDAPAAT